MQSTNEITIEKILQEGNKDVRNFREIIAQHLKTKEGFKAIFTEVSKKYLAFCCPPTAVDFIINEVNQELSNLEAADDYDTFKTRIKNGYATVFGKLFSKDELNKQLIVIIQKSRVSQDGFNHKNFGANLGSAKRAIIECFECQNENRIIDAIETFYAKTDLNECKKYIQ